MSSTSRVHIAQRGSSSASTPARGHRFVGLPPPPPPGIGVTRSARAAASPVHNVDLAIYEAVCQAQSSVPLYYIDSRTGETRWELPIGASASEALGGEALLARSAAAAAVEAEAKRGWVKRAASPMADARAMRTLTLAATPSGAESASEVGALKEIHAKELTAQDALVASWSAEFKANAAARAAAESELLASEAARKTGEVEAENLRALLLAVTMVPSAHEDELLPAAVRLASSKQQQQQQQQQQRAPTPARHESDAEYSSFIDAIYSRHPAAPRESLHPQLDGAAGGQGEEAPPDALGALHAKRLLFHRIRAKVRSGAHSPGDAASAVAPRGVTIEAMMQQQHLRSEERAAAARVLAGSAAVVAEQRGAHAAMARTFNSSMPRESPRSDAFRPDAIPPPPPPLDIYAPSPIAASRRPASAARGAKTRESLLAVRLNVLAALVRNESLKKLWRDAVRTRLFPVAARVPGSRDPPSFASTCEREYLRRTLRVAVGIAPDDETDAGITRAELHRALSASPFDEVPFTAADILTLSKWSNASIDGFVELVVGVGGGSVLALHEGREPPASDAGVAQAQETAKEVLKQLRRRRRTLSDFYRTCVDQTEKYGATSDRVRLRHLVDALAQEGVRVRSTDVTQLFACLDADRNGSIVWAEFIAIEQLARGEHPHWLAAPLAAPRLKPSRAGRGEAQRRRFPRDAAPRLPQPLSAQGTSRAARHRLRNATAASRSSTATGRTGGRRKGGGEHVGYDPRSSPASPDRRDYSLNRVFPSPLLPLREHRECVGRERSDGSRPALFSTSTSLKRRKRRANTVRRAVHPPTGWNRQLQTNTGWADFDGLARVQ